MTETYDAGLLNDYGGGNVEWWHDYMRAELARAHDFYAALPCKGGEGCQNCGSTDTVENLAAGGFVSCCPERKMAATPTTEPDTGRGLREALEALLHAVCGPTGFAAAVRQDTGTAYPWPALDIAEAQALAALSDTPSGSSE